MAPTPPVDPRQVGGVPHGQDDGGDGALVSAATWGSHDVMTGAALLAAILSVVAAVLWLAWASTGPGDGTGSGPALDTAPAAPASTEVPASAAGGSRPVTVPYGVPDLSGLSGPEAVDALRLAGLTADANPYLVGSCEVPVGRVVATVPQAGADVPAGTIVHLTLSTGDPMALVPVAVGRTEEEGRAVLADLGFPTGTKVEYRSEGHPDVGRVTAQSITPGATASTCEPVVLTVVRTEEALGGPARGLAGLAGLSGRSPGPARP